MIISGQNQRYCLTCMCMQSFCAQDESGFTGQNTSRPVTLVASLLMYSIHVEKPDYIYKILCSNLLIILSLGHCH